MTRCMGCMREYFGDVQVCPHCAYEQGTPAREAYHLMPESVLEGRYILGKVLGFGGFGVTYIGWDAQLERIVAIKEFLPTNFATRMPGGTAVTVYEGGATEQFGFGLHRFVEEAQRLAQFNGIKGITDIYDTFSGNNTAYIVMEYLKGRDVKVLLATEGALPYERARDIVIKVCDTLMPVHQKGIIHRDISPDNIYLTDDGEVKLLDFGAARYESSVNSKSLSVILKSGYAPEEQYRSRGEQGPWTDVYALAATFYKMLTGATPPDSMERAVRDEIKEPSKLGAQLPKSAENTILNALNIKKADRTKSVEEFKAELQAGEVERVKVKKRHTKSGKVPVPAIVGMALAGALLVAFIALDAAGVVEIGGEVAAPDNFGAAVETGMIVVPNIENLTESEAKQKLEELGLSMEIGVPYISGIIDEGEVILQEPVAGKQLAKGEIVAVRLSAGTLQQAMDSGAVPNIVGTPASQVYSFLNSLESEYDYRIMNRKYAYEYNAQVPIGTVSRFVFEGEKKGSYSWNKIDIYISAGADDAAAPMGEVRAPFFYQWGSDFIFFAAAASNTVYESEQANRIIIEGSTNGVDWESLCKASLDSPYEEMAKQVDKTVPVYSGKFAYDWAMNREDLSERQMQLRVLVPVEQEYDGYSDERNIEAKDIIMLEQSLKIVHSDKLIGVDSHEWLTMEQAVALVDEGEHTEEEIPTHIRSFDGQELYYIVLQIKGDFVKNRDYTIMGGGRSGAVECLKDGELLIQMYWMDWNNEEELTIYARGENEFSQDGLEMIMNLEVSAPWKVKAGQRVEPSYT